MSAWIPISPCCESLCLRSFGELGQYFSHLTLVVKPLGTPPGPPPSPDLSWNGTEWESKYEWRGWMNTDTGNIPIRLIKKYSTNFWYLQTRDINGYILFFNTVQFGTYFRNDNNIHFPDPNTAENFLGGNQSISITEGYCDFIYS
jgi:hypothetical protein